MNIFELGDKKLQLLQSLNIKKYIYRRDSLFRSIYALDHGVMDHIKHYRMVFTISWKSAKAGWGASRTMLLQEGK